MDARKLPTSLRTAEDMDRKLWGEILALHASIDAQLGKHNVDLYETGRQAEQLARRLGRLDALRTQMRAVEATRRKAAQS